MMPYYKQKKPAFAPDFYQFLTLPCWNGPDEGEKDDLVDTMSATVLLAAGLAAAVWSFAGIVRRYRKPAGFPWLHALAFAAAAVSALAALRALLGS